MDETLREKIESYLLGGVQKPAQYIGGEVNEVRKEWSARTVSVALGYPDVYSVGMSWLGLGILYEAVNRMTDAAAERVFCPWVDAEKIMRERGIPLFSWESRRAVREFDFFGITLQHEACFSNVLYMLDLAGIPLRAAERGEEEPLVIGGGPLADCCEPVADFFDLVVLGDGEETLCAVVEKYRELREAGATRREKLLALARAFEFVYVPSLYECKYEEDGKLLSCEPVEEGVPKCVKRAEVHELDGAVFPTAPLVANTETIHDRIAIEIMRGCPQRCAFCHAGHTRGSLRRRSMEKIVELAWESYRNTGHDTVSLLSLSSSDYPKLGELVKRMYERFEGCHVGISLPSLRVDRQLRDLPGQVNEVRREGLTVAVEAASDRLRKAIGKRVTDTDLMATMRAAYEAGWKKVKLYFMVGFPEETEEDILGIVELSAAISRLRCEAGGAPAAVNAAVSWLVPKAHTPFGWIAQKDAAYFQRAKDLLLDAKRNLRGVPITLKFHGMEQSCLEGVFSRGDRRLGRVLEEAYREGARFDGWNECFDWGRYVSAFARCGMDPVFYANRERGENEVLPWDHLSHFTKGKLYRRYRNIQMMLREEQGKLMEDDSEGINP